MSRVAVAVSGGIDSLYTLYLLKQQGYEVLAVHALFAPAAEMPEGLEESCEQLGSPLHIFDFREKFQKDVIDYATLELGIGNTPNPCAVCNKNMKFGVLRQSVFALGADFYATGHYAAIERNQAGDRYLIPAADSQKDQAYFLSLTPRRAFYNVLFPLATLTKQEVKQRAIEAGLRVPLARDSQDACFWQDGLPENESYHQAPHASDLSGEIWLVGEDGKEEEMLGLHRGLAHYTHGQRRGLGIAYKEPLFVVGKDLFSNRLHVSLKKNAGARKWLLTHINYFLEPAKWPEILYARLRYRQKPVQTHISSRESGLLLNFEERQITAPGQIGVVYDETGRILAGGILAQPYSRDG